MTIISKFLNRIEHCAMFLNIHFENNYTTVAYALWYPKTKVKTPKDTENTKQKMYIQNSIRTTVCGLLFYSNSLFSNLPLLSFSPTNSNQNN